MRYRSFIIVVPLLTAALHATAADFGLSVGVSIPGVQIGISVPAYPALQPVAGYPVYYGPAMPLNYFYYGGLYWVYDNDTWYSASWYDGPWTVVVADAVPVFVLRVPVRYYMRPPPYFRVWSPDRAPRWEEHWGPQWAQRHRDWDRWDRRAAQPAAPLPTYQRLYAGQRYPNAEQQQTMRQGRDRVRPRESRPRHLETAPRPLAQLSLPAPEQRPLAAPPGQTREATPPEQARPQPWRAAPTREQDTQRVESPHDRQQLHRAEPTRQVTEQKQPQVAQSARPIEAGAAQHNHAERQPREHRD